MRIIIEDEVTTSKKDFFAFPFKTFKFQTLPTKKFIIPLQQREYDWPFGTNINELLADLDQHLLNLPSSPGIPQDPATTSNYYYSGTILCENQGNETLKLIDGQQRITTLYFLNFTGYLLTKLRFYTIPPMSPARYQRELTNRFNAFTKWENRCFIKQLLTDNLADIDDDDELVVDENLEKKNKKTSLSNDDLNKVNKSILNRIGDKWNSPEDNYWPFLEPRLGFSDSVVISPRFIQAICETEIKSKNEILTFNGFDKNNPYLLGISIIIKYLNEKIVDPKPDIDNSIPMMLEYLEYYISHLSMTCIISENENDSFTLFEILNERGQDITALDLLKNLIKEREQIPGASAIIDFSIRWRDIKRNVKGSGAKGKADSNFVKFLIRSESNTAEKKQITYLRTNSSPGPRAEIFCNESISHFFLRLQKCSEIIYALQENASQDPTTNSSPFDNDKHTCFQYATFMRMIGYDWGQQVIIGSNVLHLVASNYSYYPNPSLSLNDNHPNNWKQTNSNPANPDLKHFQRFLGDIMLKIGIVGAINKLSSNLLPDCSKTILDKIIHHSITYGVNCSDPLNLRLLMSEILTCSNVILNANQKIDFNNRLISDFLVDSGPKKSIARIILYLIYTRTYTPTFNCPELEHFEPNMDRVPGPPYYNKGDRSIMVSRLGNFFLIDRAINRDFSNRAIYDKLNTARTVYPTNPMIITNLFQNVDFTLVPPVITDPIHGPLPLIRKATTNPPAPDDSFEIDNTPTEMFFNKRTELLSNLAANYIFDSQNFIHTNTPYL